MATALNASTDPNVVFHILEQALCNSNFSEEQRQHLRIQAASALPSNGFNNGFSNLAMQPSLAHQTPRSMSAYSTPTTITQTPTPDPNPSLNPNPMDRAHSAPALVQAGRSMSALPINTNNMGSMFQRSVSSISDWQLQNDEQSTSYALYSQSAAMRKQPSLQPIHETITFGNEGVVEYDPAEYVNTCIEPLGSSPLPIPRTHNPNRLHVAPLTQDSQWSPSLDGSISPSTSALMTPVTMSSNPSHHGSFNPQFVDDLSMLRVHSDCSSIFPPVLSEDGSPISFSFDVDAKNISACADTPLFSTFTGSSSEHFPSPALIQPSASALESSQQQSYLTQHMRRSASSSSDASSASASSTNTRQSRREREIKAQASRKIAPKAMQSHDETKSASSNIQMKRVLSEDGSSKDVAPITKAPYIRPHHAKIMCTQCDIRPEGFRGTHELERHVQRAHALYRKGYICVDDSSDKKFLANCKHCRNKKVYGAYYNAAAHLRRAHFHPRKRGRKGKNDQRRGGIGGGDDPPMELLKQRWITEVEVAADKQPAKKSAADSYAASFSDDSHAEDSFEYDEDMDSAYPQTATNDMQNMSDYNQYIEPAMFMNANDWSTNINNFQFDAYTTQQ